MNRNLKIAALAAAAGVAAIGAFSSLSGSDGLAVAAAQGRPAVSAEALKPNKDGKVVLTETQWRRLLRPAQYNVLRREGTEPAYSHAYNKLHGKGTFTCAGCGQPLFSSETKFESGTGWPSFYQPISKSAVTNVVDRSHGMERTEVQCSRCDGHLGHVFDDGPKPTGLRYCMNGLALKFIPAPKAKNTAKNG